MTTKIINAGNILNSYSAKINDIDLVPSTIISIEISYKDFTPVVLGKIIIDDLLDLNQQQVWRDSKITIRYTDILNETTEKEFVILNISQLYNEEFKKVFEIQLQDVFSYTLEHSFLSKSFSSNPVSALEEYIAHLKLDNYKSEITPCDKSYKFVVPKNISNLEWFLKELNKLGYTFYQTKKNICVKTLEDLKPSNLPKNSEDAPYLNETDNELYKNRIFDLNVQFNKRKDILPKTRTLAFNIEKKSFDSITENDNKDYFLSKNKDEFNLQDSNGLKDCTQEHLNFEEHTKKLKESYLSQAEVQITTNGYINNDILQIYELYLKGNIGSADSSLKGDVIIGGEYVSYVVIDKIINQALIQKIYLHRTDMGLNT